MKKLLSILLLTVGFRFAHPAQAQEVKHAPNVSVSQCRADATMWGHATADYFDSMTIPQIDVIEEELLQCGKTDSRNEMQYDDVFFQVDTVEASRYVKFIKRHGLWKQLMDEDAAGAR